MTFAQPILAQFPDHPTDQASVSLSALTEALLVQVPDSNDIPANWSVYPILGEDPQNPDWTGAEEETGVWDDATDDALKRTNIELRIPQAVLEHYLNRPIILRYKFQDESSLEPCSLPVKLHITA
ncbi:hypothetical protein GIW70_11530 [Pseudomonas syringae]|nr:hypothetical protein [Pseudomonas syringae]MCF5068814.1 hypothetical protein [Pseudomonas syringae]